MTFKATKRESPNTFWEKLRLNPEFADVVLLVGPQEQKIYAHSAIIAESCEYYRNALSERWNSKALDDEKQQQQQQQQQLADNRRNRAVIKHPDTTPEVANAILTYLYSGSTDIPYSLLMRVAIFADQLLLADLMTDALACLTGKGVVTPTNAIEVFQSISSLSAHIDVLEIKSHALTAGMADMEAMLETGRKFLKQMDQDGVAEIIAFFRFTPEHRWQILIGWMKARQDVADLSVISGIPDDDNENFDLSNAAEDIEELLGKVGFFTMTENQHTSMLMPYFKILPASVKMFLNTHFNVDSTWGRKFANSNILTNTQLSQLLEKLEFRNTQLVKSSISTVKLHSGADNKFSPHAFHNDCNGRANTMVLVRLGNGMTIGAFTKAAWNSSRMRLPLSNDFIFNVTLSNILSVQQSFLELHGIYCDPNRGPIFGNEFAIDNNAFSCIFSNNQCAQVRSLFETYCNRQNVTEYEVFQLS
ncbi:hypothetical protein HK100_009185 [Physocladia obscura]|uniref:BTB domain-containing protein n=1 Tax=Physocladia obscura TaxID=109957 RepID=A0AAD5SNV5_9FUNG|nr:hypothetical protein HK100_009185 [Physocladia obscura]